MSPGATFERVYNELKRMLAEGELPPGTPIEPALIGKEIAASITPVRDALHRLTGERLVEAPNHNGFRVPLPTEAALRDLYSWNAQLLVLAARRIVSSPPKTAAVSALSSRDVAAATASLFVEIARQTGSPEHVWALKRLNDRLAPFRSIEALLFDNVAVEYRNLLRHFAGADRRGLAGLLTRYHRRRVRAAPEVLTAISRGSRPSAT